MTIDEPKLSAAIRAGQLERLYFLYGKEVFLTRTYTDRLMSKTLGKEPIDFNFVRFNGMPSVDALGDAIDAPPVFADWKVIYINDPDPEKTDTDTLNGIIALISDIPEGCMVIMSVTGFELDTKKAKTKKLIAAAEKSGCVCELTPLTTGKIAELVMKKAAKSACVISRENASYLCELTLRNITLVSEETAKLCSYVGEGGEITRDVIDSLVAKQLDTSIYSLATEISAGNPTKAFGILDELISQSIQPVVIMSALSGAFIDFYRAKIGRSAGVGANDITVSFAYPKNRAWAVGKAINAVTKINVSYLRGCIERLSDADLKLKSSGVNSRVIMEQTVAMLIAERQGV